MIDNKDQPTYQIQKGIFLTNQPTPASPQLLSSLHDSLTQIYLTPIYYDCDHNYILMLAGVSRFGLFSCFRRAPLFNGAPKFLFSQFFEKQDFEELKNLIEGQERKKYLHYKITDHWQKPLQKKKRRQLRIQEIKKAKPPQEDIQKLVVHNSAVGIQYPPKLQQVFAIIKVDGFQYKVLEDSILILDKKPEHAINEPIIFKDVNLIGTKSYTLIGRPFVQKAVVEGIVESISSSEKIIVFKKKRRKNYRKSFGSRVTLTQCRITKISHEIGEEVLQNATKLD